MEKETKHTPGTWIVETNAEYNGRRWSCIVSTLHGMHCIEGGTAGEAKANAELIASAPTLKAENEALEEMHTNQKNTIKQYRADKEKLQTELSEMKKEREELFQEVHRIISNAACKLDALDMLESLLSRIKK